jgi:hypothetical protein
MKSNLTPLTCLTSQGNDAKEQPFALKQWNRYGIAPFLVTFFYFSVHPSSRPLENSKLFLFKNRSGTIGTGTVGY